jgi:uroporphyrinogen decarboxylase
LEVAHHGRPKITQIAIISIIPWCEGLGEFQKITNGVDALILDCGINATFPLECAAGMDARRVRKKFGKNLIIVGNIDKRALAKGKREIDAELDKVQELLKYSGYIPNVDHQIPPDISYENAKYLFDRIKKMKVG